MSPDRVDESTNRPTRSSHAFGSFSTGRLIAAVVAVLGAFVGLVILLYASSIHVAAGRSDKATTILVGESIAHGHLLLRDWTLPPGNYWTTDSAIYAVAIRIFGLHDGLLYSEPAAIAALVVVASVLFAREGRRGLAAAAGGVAAAVLLVFAPPAMALWFVGNGFHVATALYALVAFALLRRDRVRWRWLAAVALIAFGMIGDKEMVVFAILPLVGAGVVASARQRSVRAGLPLLAAGVVSGVGGEVAMRILNAIGSFTPGPPLPYAHVHQMVRNVGHLFTYSADLLGITNGRFGTAGVPHALLDLHILGGLVVVASVLAALVSLVRGLLFGTERGSQDTTTPPRWQTDDLLVLAVLASASPFVLLAGPNGVGIHFLSIPVIFATVLTGRKVAQVWPFLAARRLAIPATVIGVAACCAFGAGLGYELNLPAPPEPSATLASWLEAHHLSNGLGPYWTAAITTVVSDDHVKIRPVGIDRYGHVRRMLTQSPASWYDGQKFDFYVSSSGPSYDEYKTAAWTWGNPAHVYRVGDYWVLTWKNSLTLSGGGI